MKILVKRVYEAPSAYDSFRVLVDRIWPRGISKEAAHIDLWLKEIAPSHELRKWFNHNPEKWEAFKKRYILELDAHPQTVKELFNAADGDALTLLYSARDTQHNQAVALKEYLEKSLVSTQ